MPPRLVALTGPLQGQAFELGDAELLIGRQSKSDVAITDLTVSRRHCLVRREPGGLRIVDLGSRSGTWVNGTAVSERRLEPGDRIAVGDSVLVFRVDESADELAASGTVTLEDAKSIGEADSVSLRLEDARYLSSDRRVASHAASARREQDLSALLRVSRAIGSVRDPEELQRVLLPLVLEVVPADRSAIVLIGTGPDDVRSTMAFDRADTLAATVRVSRTIARRVLTEGVGLMSNAILADTRLSVVESFRAAAVSAVLCVPLMVYERPLGLLYVDARDPAVRFDQDHLEVATAIAAMAAVALENARRVAWLEGETRRLRDDLDLEHDMVGESPSMREIFKVIAKVAPRDTTVLILGESGTGKEPAARAIHRNSPRAERSFVAINCAALPENLLESELFGHEKGAFTGATGQKKGKVELADGGTLFLDEIGELAPGLQAKLLRVLQERELERVGGLRPIKVDVRLLAATNLDLDARVREGRFRQDLFYRLSVVSFRMPPLRERGNDITLLAEHFIRKYNARLGRAVTGLSDDARDTLLRYDWPGNVRELENAIERALVLGSGETLLPEDLPEALHDVEVAGGSGGGGAGGATAPARFHDVLRETKKRLIVEAFHQAGKSYKDTARLLGLNANYLHRLIKSLDLKESLET